MIGKLNTKNICRTFVYLTAIIFFCGGNSICVSAQNQWKAQDDGCGAIRWMGNPDGAFNLEIKERVIAQPPKKILVNGGTNGGVRVRGWERSEILVRTCVQSAGRDQTEAQARTAAVRVETTGDTIRAVADENVSFGASFDIHVPVNTNLTITTHNGGINLSNLRGSIEFDIQNGGVILDKIAGDVRGQTVNGSLVFNLSGERWEGAGINARTTNGNVVIVVPEKYSARLETGTRRGNFRVNFPIEKERENNYELNLDLGAGGVVIKAVTVNGQVSIERRTATNAGKK